MVYKLGRFLQFVGLFVILPAAMAGNMLERLNVKEMLLLAGVGVALFFLGWLLQETRRPR